MEIFQLQMIQLVGMFFQTRAEIDTWFQDRIWIGIFLGIFLGVGFVVLWLPRLSDQIHQSIVHRARVHFLWAAISFSLFLWFVTLFDLAVFHSLKKYGFLTVCSQVWLSWKSPVIAFAGFVAFIIVTAIGTRFVGNKPYRYMLIRR